LFTSIIRIKEYSRLYEIVYSDSSKYIVEEREIMERRFSYERLQKISNLERWHFWFLSRREIVEKILERYLDKSGVVLDVGCGSGFTASILANSGYRLVGIDLYRGLLCKQEQSNSLTFVQTDATHLPFKEHSFGAAVLLDLLEHVEEQKVLSEALRVVKESALVIITVPAIKWLWGLRDKAAGHMHRYSCKDTRHLLESLGFEIIKIRYFQFFLFPFFILSRIIGKTSAGASILEERPSLLLNKLFLGINLIEIKFINWINWPYGSSLVIVCRKK
jgi:ubiquinone/menaquinone biosynthesis C-methylase UbiE